MRGDADDEGGGVDGGTKCAGNEHRGLGRMELYTGKQVFEVQEVWNYKWWRQILNANHMRSHLGSKVAVQTVEGYASMLCFSVATDI